MPSRTATEPATLPEWEEQRLQYGSLPPSDRKLIRDPGYLLARIRRDLEFAAGYASDTGHREDEGLILRALVQHLAGDIATYTEEGEAFLAMLEASHPQLRWLHIIGGFLGTRPYSRRDDDTMSPVVEMRARQLRLIEKRRIARTGARRWTGRIEGWEISVVDH